MIEQMLGELNSAFINVQNGSNIRAAETVLMRMRREHSYPLLLLNYMGTGASPLNKLKAAIEMKIWCETYKDLQEFQRNVYADIMEEVKNKLVIVFLNFNGEVTKKIEKTLMIAITALTVVQFPDQWRGLVNGLITYAHQNPDSTLKILQLMVQITTKYTYLTRSDPLYSEIIMVCDDFQKYLLAITEESVRNINKNNQNPVQIQILTNQMKLFYNLNYQDLHPEFQDNLKTWMQILKQVMKLSNCNSKFFACKGIALQSILLYSSKYKEDVENQINQFSSEIWDMCRNASEDQEFDDVVFNGLKFFRSIIMWEQKKQIFAQNLGQLVQSLILPNLYLNKNYENLFEQQVDTFINYFLRNAELNSRRAAAIQLLQCIIRNFPNYQTFLVQQIKGFNFEAADSAGKGKLLTLVLESGPKGFRDVDGVTQLSIDQSIIQHCYELFVKKTLQLIYQVTEELPTTPIQNKINLGYLITNLRFIFYYRLYIPKEQLNQIVTLCCRMNINSQSLREINIMVVNSLVSIKHGDYRLYKNMVYHYDENRMAEVAGDVLGMIGRYMEMQKQLSATINRLLFSVIKQLRRKNQLFYDSHLNSLVHLIIQKTSNFDFATILPFFQALGYLAYYLAEARSPKTQQLQHLAIQFFQYNIKSQSDILNFTFQILSIILQFSPTRIKFYEDLYNSTINEHNWQQQNLSIMPSNIHYISTFIGINQQRIIADKQAFQRILTKLIHLDQFELFYRLLKNILKLTNLNNFFSLGYMNILVLATQIISAKSLQGKKRGFLFIMEIAFDYTTSQVVNYMNQIQNGFFETLILTSSNIIQTLQFLRNRKVMFGSICNALVSNCFSSSAVQAKILNLLIENCCARVRISDFKEKTNETVNKKQATFQKLIVFNEIKSQENKPIILDEESTLVKAYTMCFAKNNEISQLIDPKNLQRIKKLYQRQQSRQTN